MLGNKSVASVNMSAEMSARQAARQAQLFSAVNQTCCQHSAWQIKKLMFVCWFNWLTIIIINKRTKGRLASYGL